MEVLGNKYSTLILWTDNFLHVFNIFAGTYQIFLKIATTLSESTFESNVFKVKVDSCYPLQTSIKVIECLHIRLPAGREQ